MQNSAPAARVFARLALPLLPLALLSAPLASQYATGFETITATAGGTLLTGQDTWTLPVTTPTSADWNAFTYAGNTLGVPANALGGANFVAGVPLVTPPNSFARAERVVPYGVASGKYTLTADICPKYTGTGTPVNNIASISLQPSASAKFFIMLATWPATPTGATWDADMQNFTAAGVLQQVKIPNPAFQGLATGKWYRWQADFNLTTNQILEVRLIDIAGGTTAKHIPADWYVAGGAGSTLPAPTAVRMFTGGDNFNQVAIDNLELREKSIVDPGDSVCTVSVTGAPTVGEMYHINHTTNTATKLTLSAALTAERVNCVTMSSGTNGWVGTNPVVVGPGKIFAISISGSTVTETLLGTAVGPNLSQITRVGGNLYFCTQNATNTAGSGILQSVPVTGGTVATVSDLGTLAGWGLTSGGANCITSIGTKVYAAAFDATTLAAQSGCVVVHDTVALTTAVLLQLPIGKGPSGTAFLNTAICYMQSTATRLHLFGIFGDYLQIDPSVPAVTSHVFGGAIGPTPSVVSAFCNSFDLDPNTGDLICGTRDGRVHRMTLAQMAQGVIPGVGSSPTAANNSVNGTAHIPALTLAADTSYGDGCAGNGGFELTDVASGLPSAGNTAYQLGAYSGTGGDPVVCLISIAPSAPIDLTAIGMPGCFLHIPGVNASIAGVLGGVGNGNGFVRFPLPIPVYAAGATLYRQWAEVQVTKTNLLGVVASQARKMEIK